MHLTIISQVSLRKMKSYDIIDYIVKYFNLWFFFQNRRLKFELVVLFLMGIYISLILRTKKSPQQISRVNANNKRKQLIIINVRCDDKKISMFTFIRSLIDNVHSLFFV